MISCNSAFEQGNLDLWRYINAFIIIITFLLDPKSANVPDSLNLFAKYPTHVNKYEGLAQAQCLK